MLQRRLEHLESRIGSSREADMSFDRAECAALRSALHLVGRSIVPTEGTCLVIREGRDGGAQLILVVDGEETAEVRAVITPQLGLQLIVKGDARVRWEDEVASEREAG